MGTITGLYKKSKNFLSHNTSDENFIKSFFDANEKIKTGDFIYSEMGAMSYILRVDSVVNYYHGLAFKYDFMISRLDKLYKDCWCYSDSCRIATDDEIKLLNKKIKNYRKNK